LGDVKRRSTKYNSSRKGDYKMIELNLVNLMISITIGSIFVGYLKREHNNRSKNEKKEKR
jgi:hypothetical protein